MSPGYAAVDLGAESGRVVVGRLDGGGLALDEVHRFPNVPVRVAGHLHWDVLRLFEEILTGLAAAARQGELRSVGVDTWGVDFGLLDRTGALLGNPYHYRDARTDGMPARLFARIPQAEVFAATGIQFLQLNTLYQLFAMAEAGAPALAAADRLLFMPDLFHHWLSGERVAEYSIATTSQCWDVAGHAWATSLLERAGIPARVFPPVVPPGTALGPLLPEVADRIGARGVRVVAPAAHDTGSAVAAVPARGARAAYLSSGTWSLLGAVRRTPIVNERARALGFTNEGGVDGTVRVLRNIAGLWLVQECRRSWARDGQALGYDALAAMAGRARPFQAVVDPDHPSFNTPADMPTAIQERCAATGQTPPAAREDLLRVVLESLAWKYRRTLRNLEALLGERIEVLHVVGGGSRNELLCQLTADACGVPVLAGPAEATATGNVLAQAIADGALRSWDEARELVRGSSALREHEPRNAAAWDEAGARLDPFLDRGGPPC